MKILKITYSIAMISLYIFSIMPLGGDESHVLTSYIGVILGLPLSIPLQIALEKFAPIDLTGQYTYMFINFAHLVVGYFFWFMLVPKIVLKIKKVITLKD